MLSVRFFLFETLKNIDFTIRIRIFLREYGSSREMLTRQQGGGAAVSPCRQQVGRGKKAPAVLSWNWT